MIYKILHHEHPFVMIDKRPLEAVELSWKAKGLLAYLLSRPPGWKIQKGDLVNRAKDGREAVETALRELKEAGYAELRATPQGSRWVVAEHPDLLTKDPDTGKPFTANPDTAFPPLSNKEGKKNENNKSESLFPESNPIETLPTPKKRKGSGRASMEEVVAFCVELGLPPKDGEFLFHRNEAKEWPKNWQSQVRQWKSAEWFPSQKQHPVIGTFQKPKATLRQSLTERRAQA